jgi:hypothetical protein
LTVNGNLVRLPNLPASTDGANLDAGTLYKDSNGFLKVA